jgi:hypothetical protein
VLQSALRPWGPRAARAALLALGPGSPPGRAPALAVRACAGPRLAPMPVRFPGSSCWLGGDSHLPLEVIKGFLYLSLQLHILRVL